MIKKIFVILILTLFTTSSFSAGSDSTPSKVKSNYDKAVEAGIKFAPFELATKFSYENPLIEYGTHWDQFETRFDPTKHFGWHGSNFANTPQLMSVKYMGDMAWIKG